VNLNVNLKQMNIGWAVWKKYCQFQCVYERFSVPQSRSTPERPLLGWAVCNAQELLWRRWWSYNLRSTLAIHPVPHKLYKHSNWRQIIQLNKSCHTEYCGWKTLQTDTEDRGTTAIVHCILETPSSRPSPDTGYPEYRLLFLIFQSLLRGLRHLSNSWFGDRIACILSYRQWC
jgi:hypothetical protein